MSGMSSPRIEELRVRAAPLEMTADQFRSLGHDLVDRVAGFLASIRTYPVTAATSPEEVRVSLDATRVLPEQGRDPGALLREAASLLFEHSYSTAIRVSMATSHRAPIPSVCLQTCWLLP